MRERIFNPRWVLPRLLGTALIALAAWRWFQPGLAGNWTGTTPPELCNGAMHNLRFTRTQRWNVQDFDFGCLGTYSTHADPPTIVFNPQSRNQQTFGYTLTDDQLVLRNSAGRSYAFTRCPQKTWEACTGADQFK